MRTTQGSTATNRERTLRWKRRHGFKLTVEQIEEFKQLKKGR